MVATSEKMLLCFVGQTNLLFLAMSALGLGGVGTILSSVERQTAAPVLHTGKLMSLERRDVPPCWARRGGRVQRGSGVDLGPEAQVGFGRGGDQ